MLKHLSDILKDNFGISEEDISEVQKIKKEKGGAFGEILIRKNLITEIQLLEALSIQYDIPFQPELPLDNLKSELTRHVPIQFLKKYTMVPLERSNHAPGCIIAINNPASFQPLDDLIRILGLEDFKVVLSTKNAILSVINISYDLSKDSAEQLVQNMEENGATIISEIEDRADLLDDTSDAPIIKLVNHIISQSVKARSSDIHIEPYQDSFKVRHRVDGILYDLLTPPKWIQPALISRIKVMAKMNIAEKRLPQDGR
ncbi:MAG: Flp pilus assembly complex ATPase component TadA, partial [Deltaproteobacteria bacterium]|nr:Flp pilus assembly complex ATPase component TadA [Deltaproteobacteria bacterium]